MHCFSSPQDPVSLWGPHSPPQSSPDDLHAPMSSYPTRAFSLLKSLWSLHRDKKSHKMCQEREGKGCKIERLQRQEAPEPACQGSQGESSTTSKPTLASVQSPPVRFINIHPPRKRCCLQGGPWQNNPPRKALGQHEGLL